MKKETLELIEKIKKDLKNMLSEYRYNHSIGVMNKAIELAKICSNKQIYAGEHGSFVLISSVYGLVGSAANVGYAMSKGAIVAITKSLAMELVNNGIRVNCVAPGFIKTPMADKVDDMMDSEYDARLNALHPMGLGRSEDIANGILFLLSDMSSWMTGTVLNVDGGFTAQ